MHWTTYAMALFVSTNTIVSQLVLKKGVSTITARVPPRALFDFFLHAVMSPWVWLALTLQGIGYGVWMLVISKAKLGEAFSASGAFFNILLALSSWWFFNETLTARQWLGMVVITCGVLLVTLPSR